MRTRSLVSLLILGATAAAAQGRPDVSAVDRFWPVADQLVADTEPSPSDWRLLLDTPAYRQLAQDRRTQRMLRLAYRPSSARESDSVVALGTYDAMVIRHFRRVREQRALLQQLRDSLAQVDLLNEASRLAADYLPAGEVARRAHPPLAFGFFGPAGYGDETGIVFDLLFAHDLGPHLPAFLGHEVHHYHVYHVTRLRFPERSAPEFTLLQALRNLANEGTADRINLRFPVGPPSMPAEVSPAYNTGYSEAPVTLRAIDSILSRTGVDSARMRQAGKEISDRLVYAGHPVGAWMAERIEAQLGRPALISAVGNPFAFFRAFNDAEGREGGTRPFSAPTLEVVTDLERRFFTPTTP